MSPLQTASATRQRPLRLWPGVVAVAVQWLSLLGLAVFAPDLAILGILASVVLGVVVAVWWLFFSRARWSERIGALVLMVVAVIGIRGIVDPSIAGAGMGKLLYFFSVPIMSLALVAWAVASRRVAATGSRLASLAVAIALAAGSVTLLRTDGVTGDGNPQFRWRWTPTAEERLLAQPAQEPTIAPSASALVKAPESMPPSAPAAAKNAPPAAAGSDSTAAPASSDRVSGVTWSGFRGPDRNSVIRGVRIEADWSTSKPTELWRRPIGPGWSSFAVGGNCIYTQEQRGDDELVSCYDLTSGAPVWRHKDAARFYESNGGAGPRGTPAVHDGRVYAMGATGILNALDARTGAVVWTRNAVSDTGATIPGWGITASPLVWNDQLIVATSGVLAAYELATGKLRWVGPRHGASYSSPQLMKVGGVEQVVLLSGAGATGVSPADGAVLWEHAWEGGAIVQPGVTADGDVLINSISMMGGVGLRRLSVEAKEGKWTVEERWTSNGLKPYFNDFVVHAGHAFGFDGSILACIDLADGKRKWKGGRYGNGQLILLPDQNVMLVLSEEGELALVSATTEKFTELARFPAIEGKTWNHPVLVGDVLLVRNGEEMAAFRLR